MTAWWAVIGTLGGVVVTAVFGLVTAYLTHRWQVENSAREQRTAASRALGALRREVYMRYLTAVQNFYDIADKLYHDSRELPIDPPEELQSARAAYETARVDALLVADPGVRTAIDAYGKGVRRGVRETLG